MVVNLVNISGQHVYVESGTVNQSGLGVWISGQHVYVESGVHVVADIAESGMGVQIQSGAHVVVSGQPVTISGDHVFVESGISRLHIYHPASGIWVPAVGTLSGCLAVTYCLSGGIFGD